MSATSDRKVSKQDLEKEIFDLKNLLEISKSLSSTLDYNILNDSILYTCLGALTVMKAAFFSKKSIDSADFTLHRGYLGFDIDHVREYVIPEKSSLIEFLKINFGCHSLDFLKSSLGQTPEMEVLSAIGPTIVVPLKAKGTINGLLILGEKIGGDDFNARDREYLLSIGNFAASAIHNAFMFEMTTTDMMTKLKLKHFFLNTLQERIRAESSLPFALIMLDIDRFKRLNDTYGHLAGDDVLKAVARTVIENVRAVDTAARYGGEEFIILLPDVSGPTAFEVAERIRRAIEKLHLVIHGADMNVTVSLGVAEFDNRRDLSPQAFIERVDQSLYASKENGRNRTTIAL